MKFALLIVCELVIAAVLAVIVFAAVLWQPFWIWIAAGVVMSAAFVALVIRRMDNVRQVRLLIALSPLSYTLWLLGLSIRSGSGTALLTTAAYYAMGVLLLLAHYQMNRRLR